MQNTQNRPGPQNWQKTQHMPNPQNLQPVGKYSFMEQERPVLKAELHGNEQFPDIHGEVYVYTLPEGIYLQGDFEGLPESNDLPSHIHEGLICDDPGGKLLPLPNLMSDDDGKASTQIYLDRVDSMQIAGKPIMMHIRRGNDEIEIACGLLSRVL